MTLDLITPAVRQLRKEAAQYVERALENEARGDVGLAQSYREIALQLRCAANDLLKEG